MIAMMTTIMITKIIMILIKTFDKIIVIIVVLMFPPDL